MGSKNVIEIKIVSRRKQILLIFRESRLFIYSAENRMQNFVEKNSL